jgi:IS5 family transposase
MSSTRSKPWHHFAGLRHFRHLLECHGFGNKSLAESVDHLQAQGLMPPEGSIVDATTIAAPHPPRTALAAAIQGVHQTKKGNQWYFGMKIAHLLR